MMNPIKMLMKLSSVKIKFTAVAVLISFFSFGVAAYLSTQWLAEEIEQDYKEKASLMATHIIHDLENSMLRGVHGEILTTVDLYRKYKDVEEVRIFNTKGKEVFGKEQGTAEATVEKVLGTGETLDYRKKINQKEVWTSIIPIKNKPECYGCHGGNDRLRGVLLLSLNTEGLQGYIGRQRQKFFVLFGFIATAIGVATIVAVNRLFLKRLAPIQEGTEAIQKGEFQYQIPAQPKDEIGDLADNFNRMAKVLHEKNEMLWEQVRLRSQSLKEWQETFDSITDLVAIIDQDFNITTANRAFHEYFSLPSMVEIKQKCYEIIGTCLQPNCPHEKSLRDRTPVSDEIVDSKKGKMLQISLFPYYSLGEESIGSIFIAKDITERKENEMSLIMSERLAALGQIASGIAHEINNPMATISACTEGLLTRVKNSQCDLPHFEGYLKIIEEEVNRCKNITESMLSFVRVPSSAKQDVDVNEVLDKTLEMINFQGRLNEVKVLKAYETKGLVIHGNEGGLRQVFLSVILNALDAMEDKGTLLLETGIFGDSVCVIICDSGPGIPSRLLSKIFDPFFTTKSDRGGTGLGLSIAKKIITDNKGTIEVTSGEGKGSTFTITLPLPS